MYPRQLTTIATLVIVCYVNFITTVCAGPLTADHPEKLVCAVGKQKCHLGDGDSFCCPQKFTCGSLINQCINDGVDKAVTANPTAVVTVKSTSAAAIPTPTSTMPKPASSATASQGASEDIGTKIKGFFTTQKIIIASAGAGGGLILVAAIISCCTYQRRKGRLLKAAYEDPSRIPYTNPVLTARPRTASRTPSVDDSAMSSAAVTNKESGVLENSPSSRPQEYEISQMGQAVYYPPTSAHRYEPLQYNSGPPAAPTPNLPRPEHQEWAVAIPQAAQCANNYNPAGTSPPPHSLPGYQQYFELPPPNMFEPPRHASTPPLQVRQLQMQGAA